MGGPSCVSALHDEDEPLLLGRECVLHLARAGVESLIGPLRISTFVLSCETAAVVPFHRGKPASFAGKGEAKRIIAVVVKKKGVWGTGSRERKLGGKRSTLLGKLSHLSIAFLIQT